MISDIKVEYEDLYNIKKAECDILYAEFDKINLEKTNLEDKIKLKLFEIDKLREKYQPKNDEYTIEQKLSKINILNDIKQEISNLDLSDNDSDIISDNESDDSDSEYSFTLEQKIEMLKSLSKC